MSRFIAMVLSAFLARVNPVSTSANPSCMNMTRKAPRSTQARLSDCSVCDGGMSSPSTGGGWAANLGGVPTAEPHQRREPGQHRSHHQPDGEPAPGERPPPNRRFPVMGALPRPGAQLLKQG